MKCLNVKRRENNNINPNIKIIQLKILLFKIINNFGRTHRIVTWNEQKDDDVDDDYEIEWCHLIYLFIITPIYYTFALAWHPNARNFSILFFS